MPKIHQKIHKMQKSKNKDPTCKICKKHAKICQKYARKKYEKIYSLGRVYILHIYAKYAPGTLLMRLRLDSESPGPGPVPVPT